MNDDANIRTGVLDEVRAEREAQDAQLGGPEHDDNHSPGDFAGFIDVQLIKCDWGNGPGCRERFIKVAALAVAAVEMLDRTTRDYGSDDGEAES